jgi:hypothetical protein
MDRIEPQSVPLIVRKYFGLEGSVVRIFLRDVWEVLVSPYQHYFRLAGVHVDMESICGVYARLLVISDGIPSVEFPIEDRTVVGRFDPSTGPVDVDLGTARGAETVSPRHAEVYEDSSGRWWICDLGSANGVWLRRRGASNYGSRISEPRPLEDGDEVAIGSVRLVFKVPQRAAAPPAPSGNRAEDQLPDDLLSELPENLRSELPAILRMLRNWQYLEALRQLRSVTGWDFRKAKDYLDRLWTKR